MSYVDVVVIESKRVNLAAWRSGSTELCQSAAHIEQTAGQYSSKIQPTVQHALTLTFTFFLEHVQFYLAYIEIAWIRFKNIQLILTNFLSRWNVCVTFNTN